MEGGREEKFSIGKRARTACKENFGKLACLGLFHFLPRAALAALLYWLALLNGQGSSVPLYEGLMAALLFLFIFLLLPSRFYLGEQLRALAAGKKTRRGKKGYGVFLKAGLLRLGRGLLWGAPFLTGLSLFLYGMEYLPYTDLGKLLQKFVLFGEATSARGLMIVLALLLLLLIIFALGWRRDMAMEYLPVRKIGLKPMCLLTAKARRRGRGDLAKNSLSNLLLALPAILGWGLALFPYARENMRLSSNLLRTVQSLLQLLKQLLPLTQVMQLFLVSLALYMPFFLYRKMRSAVLVQELTREWDEQEEKHAP